ncbi:uncharacterized protein LOC143460428 [Clavelina lepadiformis]|uniref:uncharacterized protein LOC143460428 n=1 Tax=Clavelina lepadiformis TaxID=159417 RepID=UPI0040424031
MNRCHFRPISPAFNSPASCNHRHEERRRNPNVRPTFQHFTASLPINTISKFLQWHAGRSVDQRLLNELVLMEEKFLANVRSSYLARRAAGFERSQRKIREGKEPEVCSAERSSSCPATDALRKSSDHRIDSQLCDECKRVDQMVIAMVGSVLE